MKFLKIFLILLTLSIPISATSLIETRIIDSQYGTFLASHGIGNVLYQYIFPDGTVKFQYVEQKQIFAARITKEVAKTIEISTSISSRDSERDIYNCNTIIVTGSDGSSESSYGCGSTQVLKSERSIQYPIWQNNLIEEQKMYYNYNNAIDTVIMNGVTIPPQSPSQLIDFKIELMDISDMTQTIVLHPIFSVERPFSSSIEVKVDNNPTDIITDPNQTTKNIVFLKDGSKHNICVDIICKEYTTFINTNNPPTPTPIPNTASGLSTITVLFILILRRRIK